MSEDEIARLNVLLNVSRERELAANHKIEQLETTLLDAREDFAHEVVSEVIRRVNSFQLGVSSISKDAVVAIVKAAVDKVVQKQKRTTSSNPQEDHMDIVERLRYPGYPGDIPTWRQRQVMEEAANHIEALTELVVRVQRIMETPT